MTFHNDMWEGIVKYTKENGLLTEQDAIRYLIARGLAKPVYAQVEERRKETVKLSPEEKALAELHAQDAKVEAKKNKQLKLCTDLQGELRANGFCYYPQFELTPGEKSPVDKFIINTPLMDLHPVDLQEQYRGTDGKAIDKEVVLAQIKKYGVKEL